MPYMHHMNGAKRHSPPTNDDAGGNAGFTLLEVLVAGFVLVVGLIFIAQFFASAIGRVTDSETRSLIHQVAAQEIEKIRAMDYADVGTAGGQPSGTLLASETITVEGVSLDITREVIFVEDASYSGPYPANYRRVTIRVQATGDSRLGPVELATLVAGGAAGGSLDITVVNTRGEPVPDALIVVNNNHLVPNVHISASAIRTDSSGHLLIPGLTPDATTAYYAEVNKAGYNSDWTDPMVVVNEGLPYTVIQFTIDQVSTLNIHVVDETGAPVTGAAMTVTGPREFAVAHPYTTDGAGLVALTGIGYSTSGNPYVVSVPAGGGHQAGSSGNIVLDPGTTQEVTIVVATNGVTTTTAAPTTTTASTTTTTSGGSSTTVSSTTSSTSTSTTVAPTTTTIGYGSVTIHVQRWKDGKWKPVKNATVSFNGTEQPTNDGGEVTFLNVAFGTYPLLVTKNEYVPYSGTVAVDGVEVVTVTLVKK